LGFPLDLTSNVRVAEAGDLFMTSSKYIEVTEETNGLDYLEKAISFIKTAENDPIDWKWVFLAVHGALYSFLICALTGTNRPDQVCVTNKAGKKKLIGFAEALARCQDSDWMNFGGFTRVLELSEEQKYALRLITDEFRNPFVHYKPTAWLIELEGIPELVAQALEVIRFVTTDMGCFYARFDRDKIADLVTEGTTLLRNPHLVHNA
jgi:hypothetical protein